jgi:voltage-gated potassium channel
LLTAAAALTGLTVVGTVGFAVILHESVGDALYRVVNTITTAGEVAPPASAAGRLFTVAVLVAGVVVFLYGVSLLGEFVVTGVATGVWQRRSMDRSIAGMRGHHVICGFGRVGSRVAQRLEEAGERVVVIDGNPEALERAADRGLLFLDGDGADDDTLAEAGIQHAAALVACVDDDATNVYVVLTAKGLRPDLHVVARASSESAAGKLRRAGADEVISPYTIAGERIAAVLTERAAQTSNSEPPQDS